MRSVLHFLKVIPNMKPGKTHLGLRDDNGLHLQRVIGSKIQIAGWTTYVAMINSLKLSMLAFYIRLMVCFQHLHYKNTTNTNQEGLSRRYQMPIWIGFALVIASFLASIITIFASCQPFHKNWQINPDPGSKLSSFFPSYQTP